MDEPNAKVDAELEDQTRLQGLARKWADQGRLVPYVFALAERADPLDAYRAFEAQGLSDLAKRAPRHVAYTLQRILRENGRNGQPESQARDDLIFLAGEFASLLEDENDTLQEISDEAVDRAWRNAEGIIDRWHKAADSVGAER